MSSLTETFRDTLVSGLRRKAITTPSRWAEAYRVMGPPFPGKWSFVHHPWLRGMHDSKSQKNVVQKAAQLGVSECLLNIAFFNIDIEARNVLYVMPTQGDSSDFSSSRFDAALELSPHLEKLFSDVKNVGLKRAGSANLYVRGSNSRSGLKSIPVSALFLDELDEFCLENIPLAQERVSGQLIWHIWMCSTPTVPSLGINAEYLLSTKEHFVFKCPFCSKQTELIFPDSVVITADHRLDPRIKDTYYICKECKHKLEKPTREQILKTGANWDLLKEARWVSFGDKHSDVRGFYINQLYSSAIEPHQIAAKFFDTESSQTAAEEFHNSAMGLPYIAPGAQVTDEEITAVTGLRRKNDTFPSDLKITTMGIDVGKFLHWVVCGWRFPRYENDLHQSAECEVLAEGKVIDFEELSELMRRYQVNCAVIDGQPERRLSHNFCAKFWGYARMCFYSNSARGKMISASEDEDKFDISVDRTSWLDCALNRFHNKTIKIPFDTSTEFKEHMKSLVRRHETDSAGNLVGRYVNVKDDHFAHALTYASIALPIGAAINCNEDVKSFL